MWNESFEGTSGKRENELCLYLHPPLLHTSESFKSASGKMRDEICFCTPCLPWISKWSGERRDEISLSHKAHPSPACMVLCCANLHMCCSCRFIHVPHPSLAMPVTDRHAYFHNLSTPSRWVLVCVKQCPICQTKNRSIMSYSSENI